MRKMLRYDLGYNNFLKKNVLITSFGFFDLTDEKESIEMNAGACPNVKCPEIIDYSQIKTFPIKCNGCNETITEKHSQLYGDIMHATRIHLDKMQNSSVTCNYRDNRK